MKIKHMTLQTPNNASVFMSIKTRLDKRARNTAIKNTIRKEIRNVCDDSSGNTVKILYYTYR